MNVTLNTNESSSSSLVFQAFLAVNRASEMVFII